LLVHHDIAAAFLGKVKDQTEKLRLGPGLKEDVQMGPLVSRDHAASVAKAIDEGVSRGAKVLAGGRRADAGELKDGNFLQPTIFEDPPREARVSREEVFGPVVAAFRLTDLDQAIAQANDTPSGPSAGVWTQAVGKPHGLAQRPPAPLVAMTETPRRLPQRPYP